MTTVNRHPEVRAQRASKGDGPDVRAVSFEGGLRPPPQDDGLLLGARRRLAGFTHTLRDNGFRVGLAETRDALAVLASPAALRPTSLKPALRALFCATHSDWERFDEIFDAFWQGRDMRQRQLLSGAPGASHAPARRLAEANVPQQATSLPDHVERRGDGSESAADGRGRREGASRAENLATTDLRHIVDPDDIAATHALAARLARVMRARLTRREQIRRRGRRLDLRRTIHRNVSHGGTLLELAVSRDKTSAMMDESRELGFDIIEVSDAIIELSPHQIETLTRDVQKRGMDAYIEVGKKNPQNQLSLRETLDRVGHALSLKPRKVILESRESGRGVGIYDGEGQIKWDWVRSITADFATDQLIFEAPMEQQQIALLRELGAETNLGNVSINSVAPLASQRLGLRGDTFGSLRSSRPVRGPPATKFLYFLLETYRGLDQSELVRLSRLPRRTVQSGLDSLRKQGLVREGVSLVDSRRREYRLT